MSRYLIGDIQGCLEPLERLLDVLPWCSGDQLWFAGDLVNRGPDSLGVLRRVRDLGTQAVTVLGNHDLHLICVAAGHARKHRSDTLDAVLAAPDREELLAWLRARPLAHLEEGFLLVHAGVLPAWNAQDTRAFAAEVERWLQGPDHDEFLQVMYGNQPASWSEDLQGFDRLRVITNALTRLRLCTAEGVMDFTHKGELADAPAGLLPWFEVASRATEDHCVLFGHWSALGLLMRERLIAVDTGCLWGRTLTAVRLEDRQVFAVPCASAQAAVPAVSKRARRSR
jgi:bis(5'-nucleosyl)-tetraphosphatase (symmetrical)